MVAKCRIVTADWKEINDSVIKDLKRAASAVGFRIFDMDTGGDYYALVVCNKDTAQKDAQLAFDKWRNR